MSNKDLSGKSADLDGRPPLQQQPDFPRPPKYLRDTFPQTDPIGSRVEPTFTFAPVTPVTTPATPPALPRILADDGRREEYPLYDGLFAYFPAALCEVARWSVVGNRKHNPGEPLHWAREKSTDHKNKIARHLLDAEQVDKDGFLEAIALAWRALALAQTLLEKRGWAAGANGQWQPPTEPK